MVNENQIEIYAAEISTQFNSGHAKEHAYRPALERLMRSYDDVVAVNDPKRSEHGNPDFIFLKASNQKIIKGYAEAKDVDINLDKTEKTNQMHRYSGYANLYLTNYLEFRFYKNGDKHQTISIGEVQEGHLKLQPENYARLNDELSQFLSQKPESIKSGKRLAEIMGAKARRIRDNVKIYLSHEGNEQNEELEKMYKMMRELLVHDLTVDKFADMYAQTLVYGLFVARYSDTTPDDFSRSEARDLIPASNPFLRDFFDHIAGPRFDARLAYIVDELCEVFSVSDVHLLVQKHLRLFEVDNDKDPIIHFYEDFLKEYDPAERKKMGAYYTPIPVVKFIIKQVDEILKKEFGLAKGIADTSKIDHITTDTGGKKYKNQIHRVQILDPAVGTATFLDQIIKYVHKTFEGQEGRWPAYAETDLIPRLHGFELMMAPYTIAHLKLGMTLQESGVKNFGKRLGVYLTNTLEEGVRQQTDIFNYMGLAETISHEAEEAAKIKNERPIMVVIGNPPYSVSSNNKSAFIENLVKDYKKDLNERNIQPLSDDYIKFIRFAEDMIEKNGEGVVAMITNNSYMDGIIHRQMRKHLLTTFDKIFILDLHGNSKKKETAPDGTKDVNVFDIQQGVGIVIAVKLDKKTESRKSKIYYDSVYGSRRQKFQYLDENIDTRRYKLLPTPVSPRFTFEPEDNNKSIEYNNFISINSIMPVNDVGISSYRDSFVVDMDRKVLAKRINEFFVLPSDEVVSRYGLKFSQGKSIEQRQKDGVFDESKINIIDYRPFDKRYMYVSDDLVDRLRAKNTKHIINHKNLSLVTVRRSRDESKIWNEIFITENLPTGATTITSLDRNYVAPFYLYHDDETHTQNFDKDKLNELLSDIGQYCYTNERSDLETPPENFWVTAIDVLDYIYGVLHGPSYREKYKEFLKIDFPRVPKPKSAQEFSHYAVLGRELRDLHLMKHPNLDTYNTTYPMYDEAYDNIVEGVTYAKDVDDTGKVWINSRQYFGNVPEIAWNFYIGGYQPAQKWLKDRKGRKLSNDDIDHYQKIIKVLVETNRIMQEIDKPHK